MPETYTQEQIEKAIETLKKCIEIEGRYETGPYRCRQPTLGGYVYVSKGVFTIPLVKERDIVLSALSTAEQEREALKAQCAELEAELVLATKRGEECAPDIFDYMNGFVYAWLREETPMGPMPIKNVREKVIDMMQLKIRAAIVGKKEG